MLASPVKQNLSKIRNWLGAPELVMAPLTRGGVENTKLEAKAKDTKKNPRPRTALARTDLLKDRNAGGQGLETMTQRGSDLQMKKVFAPKSKNSAILEPRTGLFRGLAHFEAKAQDFKLCLQGLHFGH